MTLIIFDHREQKSKVIRHLFKKDCKLESKQLPVGDFLLSQDVVCERKSIDDYLQSLIQGRLFQQAKKLRGHYKKPCIIIEGSQDIYSKRKISANAIRASIISIALDFGISVIYTKDEEDTANYLLTIAKREQEKFQNNPTYQTIKKPVLDREQQEFIIQAFPKIGVKTSKILLMNFRTIENIINASKEELMEVEGIGKKTANEIREIITKKYEF